MTATATLCGAPTSRGGKCRNPVAAPGAVCGKCKARYYHWSGPPPAAADAPPSPRRAAPARKRKRRRSSRSWWKRTYLGVSPRRVGWRMIGMTAPRRQRTGVGLIAAEVLRSWRRQRRSRRSG